MKQELFDGTSVREYLTEYTLSVEYYLDTISATFLNEAIALILKTKIYSGRLFVAGNGGSAAIAEHLSCDFTKGAESGLSVISLTSNTSILTAIGNDLGYQNVFCKQLEYHKLNKNDVVILISSSGNSPNIVKAADFSISNGSKVIGLSGFDGGGLKERADVSLHIPVNNYGVVEDCHQILMHSLTQFMLKESNLGS